MISDRDALQDVATLVALLLEIVALIIVSSVSNPTDNSFLTYDATISFSYQVDSTIPYYVAILVPLISLLLSFVVLELLLWHVGLGLGQQDSMTLCVLYFLDFVGAGVVTGLLTEITKNIVGRYRPDWLSRCQPEISNPVNISGFGLPSSDNPACTSDLSSSKMNDGRKSFPSGHASTSFCLGLFVCGYCVSVLKRLSKLESTSMRASLSMQLIFLWILFQISWAWGVAVSRIIDHKHHESDIIAGLCLGSLVGLAFSMKSLISSTVILCDKKIQEESASLTANVQQQEINISSHQH